MANIILAGLEQNIADCSSLYLARVQPFKVSWIVFIFLCLCSIQTGLVAVIMIIPVEKRRGAQDWFQNN